MSISRRGKTKSESSNVRKFSIPSVQITELLELESLFPEIKLNLAIVLFAAVYIGQIRVKLPNVKPNVIQGLESVNTLNKKVLAKSPPLVYVTSAVAIRKTMLVYANDSSETRILSDHDDLRSDLTGPILPTNKGASAMLGSPEKLRAYRRGIMAQVTGSIQSTPVHSPRRITVDIEDVTPDNFMERIPFDVSNIQFGDISSRINSLICPDGTPLRVTDIPTPQGMNLAPCINMVWDSVSLPEVKDSITDKTPIWKRAAITQARNIKGG